eukprot:1930335-Pleurochrysis_carterae.AAC.1
MPVATDNVQMGATFFHGDVGTNRSQPRSCASREASDGSAPATHYRVLLSSLSRSTQSAMHRVYALLDAGELASTAAHFAVSQQALHWMRLCVAILQSKSPLPS